jgi:hypothetical protein
MTFKLWRGVVGMVRPTRRPGTLEELIRILPEGIGVVPLPTSAPVAPSSKIDPQYEQYAELAEQGVDLIILPRALHSCLAGRGSDPAVGEQI